MSDTKHTLGPLETASVNAGYYDDEPAHVAIVGPLPGRHLIARVYGSPEQAQVDARLYAAAPDLLAALINILPAAEARIEEYGSSFRCTDEARAAIAKATEGA